MCQIWPLVHYIFQAYIVLMLVYAVVSWIPSIRGRWTEVVGRLVEPVLTPIRRIIPPIGGFDLAFLIVILLIQFVDGSIVRHNMALCGGYGL